MRYAALLLALLSFPAVADDVPPMPPDAREKFDNELAKVWHSDCSCYRFLFDGAVKEIRPPITEKDRWALMDVLERGIAIPLSPKGQSN